MEKISKIIKYKNKWWEICNLTDDFAKYIETTLYWACDDCWCSPCECWNENY